MQRAVLLLVFLLTCPLVTAQPITREQSERLMAQCHAEREEKLAPLREQAVQNCLNRNMSDRETCERRNENYGNRRNNGSPGLFWDLPSCEQGMRAERFFRQNPRAQEYYDG